MGFILLGVAILLCALFVFIQYRRLSQKDTVHENKNYLTLCVDRNPEWTGDWRNRDFSSPAESLAYIEEIILKEAVIQEEIPSQTSSSNKNATKHILRIRIIRASIPMGKWENRSFCTLQECWRYLDEILLKEPILQETLSCSNGNF